MGYPLPNNSPQFQVSGQTYAVAAFNWDTPIGAAFYIGVFIRMPNGEWNSVTAPGNGVVAQYMNQNETLADVQAKGGRVKYLQWVLTRLNQILAALFAAAPPVPTGEPTTEAQAREIISAFVAGLSISGNPPVAK